MLKKIKNWLDKPLSMKVFVGSVFCIIVFYIMQRLTTSIYDSDMYFLIASGREILKNGIPYNNIWTIDSNSAIIIQQWLYDVILAFVDKTDTIGFTLFSLTEFVMLIYLITRFLSHRKLSFGVKCMTIAVTVMFSQLYIFSLRPELITLILLLAECICLENFIDSHKSIWLCMLPVLMLLEINLHASMWPVHYAIILAYAVPAFYMPGTINDSFHKYWKQFIISIIAMTAVMFVNPYGLDGILYIVKSFTASTFDYINIVELESPDILSTCGCSVIIGVALLLLCIKTKTIRSISMNMAVGFILLVASTVRNNMFAFFILLYLMRDAGDYFMALNINWKKDVKNYLYVFLIIGNVICINSFLSSAFNMFSDDIHSVGHQLESIYEYIDSNGDLNSDSTVHTFTGFNCGAYFEYKGMTNIYMDARPELYSKAFTGDKDILRDYSRYAVYGYSTIINTADDNKLLTQTEMDNWFDSYKFDYVIVSEKTEMNLAAYMRNNSDYKQVPEQSGMTYVLYECVK